jgi:DNA-binding transcriptional LysR family regulator
VLNAQAILIRQAQVFIAPDKRLIRIGMSPLVSAHLVGLMIEPFRRQHPDVDVILREMNMQDLHRMLDEARLDFVFGIAEPCKTPGAGAFLYEEPLLFIPAGGAWTKGPREPTIHLKAIADETYVMVPDACGLSRATRALFRSHRRRLREYSGQAMSYQVLEEWAALGIGAAILPQSKVVSSRRAALPITDKAGRTVMIAFEAVWSRTPSKSPHLVDFAQHLRQVVPGIVAGLEARAGS